MQYEEYFYDTYNREPDGKVFCPYRVCPIGAHIDHQNGIVHGIAIDRGIHIAYAPKQNGVIELRSVNFPKRAQFHLNGIPQTKEGDWADHMRGAARMLMDAYPLRIGLAGVIEGTLPIGGLSSSAAVIIAFLSALAAVNHIQLEKAEIIQMAKAAENRYVGVNCGKLDQSCEVLCQKDHLLYLDCQDDSYQLIEVPKSMKPFKIGIFFSGLERSLKNSRYNLRVDECKAAAYSLLAFAGREYGKYEDTCLRDVPEELYDRYGDKLPEAWRRRAEHFYTESARVKAGSEAWRKGDIEAYGQLVFESGESSIQNYQCGGPELIRLYEILRETDGVYGGRFSGAGFKGCCMALIDPAKEEEIEDRVTREYLKSFPELAGKYECHFCESSDGIRI